MEIYVQKNIYFSILMIVPSSGLKVMRAVLLLVKVALSGVV